MFAIFDSFSSSRRSMTLSEISRASGLPLSTAHRLVSDLVAWGGLERDAQGGYRVGLHVWELGSLAPRGTGLVDVALPFLEDLYEATHENIRLAVREGTEVIFVAHIAGHGSVPLRTKAAERLPMPTTGVGMVLLAHAPADILNAVLESDFPRFTPFSVPDAGTLRRVLADVRRDGFAICDRQMTDLAVSVAAPIHSASGEVIAAVSVAVRGEGPAAVRALIPTIHVAAKGISRALAQPRPVRRRMPGVA
jgi:DNA-binding IclR family transcriptional regulator